NQKTVPARMRHELARIAAALVHRIFPAHFDVAAKRQCVDAVIGVAFAKAEKPFAEADGKLLHPHAQQLGDRIVAKFMDQYHEANDNDEIEQRNEKLIHKILVSSLASPPRRGLCWLI